jgi:hypothetical protein
MWVGKMISVLDSRLGWQIWVFISFPHVTKLGKILKSTKVKLYFEIDYSPRNCAVDPFRPIWNHIHKTTLFTLEIENTTENLQLPKSSRILAFLLEANPTVDGFTASALTLE